MFYKQETHMIDGPTFAEVLKWLATVIPGGVSPSNRFLLVLDGHASRLDPDALDVAIELGFVLLLFPGQCTHFLQPWDQLFGYMKGIYERLVNLYHISWASEDGEFVFDKPRWLGIIDAALAEMMRKRPNCFKDALKKTCMWPFDREKFDALVESQLGKEVPEDDDDPAPDSTDAPLTEKQKAQLDELLRVEKIISKIKKGPAQFNRQLVRIEHQVTKPAVVEALRAKRQAKEAKEAGVVAKREERAANKLRKEVEKKKKPKGLNKAQKRARY